MRCNNFAVVLAAVAIATLALTAASSNAALVGQLGVLDVNNANYGINPATGVAWAAGDQYRLTFHTEDKRDATSSNIADYNTFVQSVAAGSTAFPDLGNGTWKVLGSTATVSARENTGTVTNSNMGIFVLDGVTMIASDSDDMWDGWDVDGNSIRINTGDINTSPHYSPWLNENGAGDTGVVHGVNCATGTNPNGTIRTPLGGPDRVNWGSSNANRTGRVWVRWDSGNPAADWSFYALSDPLTVREAGLEIIPEPSTFLIWALGLLGLACYGRRRRRA
jgi:MYXO-CTERM domain-containing protein